MTKKIYLLSVKCMRILLGILLLKQRQLSKSMKIIYSNNQTLFPNKLAYMQAYLGKVCPLYIKYL